MVKTDLFPISDQQAYRKVPFKGIFLRWNNLPNDITGLESLPTFKGNLKTYLFRHAFNLLPH